MEHRCFVDEAIKRAMDTKVNVREVPRGEEAFIHFEMDPNVSLRVIQPAFVWCACGRSAVLSDPPGVRESGGR